VSVRTITIGANNLICSGYVGEVARGPSAAQGAFLNARAVKSLFPWRDGSCHCALLNPNEVVPKC